MIELYLANVEGFEGQGDFFSKFGLEIRDTSNFIASRRAFAKYVPTYARIRPQEGDLIYVPLLHKMFEIKFIEQELMFHSLGKRLPYVYEMRCEAFRFSQDEIDTGIDEIDQVAAENSYTERLVLNTNGTGLIYEEDIVYQSPDRTFANATSYGTVKDWFKANGSLFIYDITGSFTANANVYAKSTNAVYRLASTDDLTDYVIYDVYDNKGLDTGSDLILDLSEINPFGVP
jgi:hypothetical protein